MTMIARRRMIALTAAYAIALQAILSSFILLPIAGRSAQEVCAPAGKLPQSPPNGPDCSACPVPCGGTGLAGAAPDDLVVAAWPAHSPNVEFHVADASLPTGQRLLPPPRAPPAA